MLVNFTDLHQSRIQKKFKIEHFVKIVNCPQFFYVKLEDIEYSKIVCYIFVKPKQNKQSWSQIRILHVFLEKESFI